MIGCNQYNDNLKSLDDNAKIYEKNIAFKEENIEVDESRVESINGTKYIIEEKEIYDNKGILYLLTGGSEGFITHSRNNEKGTLPIDYQERYKGIKIDKNHNYIIDNQDTIRKFKIFIDDKIILTSEIEDLYNWADKNNRVYIYKFN
jgi:hypothetical protein